MTRGKSENQRDRQKNKKPSNNDRQKERQTEADKKTLLFSTNLFKEN
jgi:hypothetical protein